MGAIDSAGKIVVGTDGSLRADKAIEWAANRATARGLTCLIVLVIPEAPIPSRTGAAKLVKRGPELSEQLRERGEKALDEVAERIRAKYPEGNIETVLVEGNPGKILAEASADADLVVVGARGRSAPTTVKLLGGVSDVVTSHAPGAVAVIPDDAEYRISNPVVVGVDDSKEAQLAISRGFDAARVRKVPLIFITAWDYGPYDAYNAEVWEYSIAEMNAELTKEVERLIADEKASHPDVEVEIRSVRGRAATALIEASKEAGMLVIGSRGRGGFAGLLLGSTSKQVLREARCPVIVIRGRAGWRNVEA